MSEIIRSVWSKNLKEEIALLDYNIDDFPIVTFDTEFPGFIRNSPWGATEEKFYQDLCFNVNQMKLIQLGLTISNHLGHIGFTWEFNFRDFDPETDPHNASSVSFLKEIGFDFTKLKKDGILIRDFKDCFLPIFRKSRISRWVTFHGFYDVAYLLKAMIAIDELPSSKEEFARMVENLFGKVSDLKFMACFCEGLENGKLGLERLGRLMEIERVGKKHEAGSDSLLTALLYAKMKERFQLDSDICEGYLYGLKNRICYVEDYDFDMKTALKQRLRLRQRQIYGGHYFYYQPCFYAYC